MKEIIEKIGIKKIIIGITTFVIIMIIFFGGALLYNKFFYKKKYSEIETIMTTAAKKYYNENKERLPQNEGEKQTIEASKLAAKKYMKTIEEYLKDDSKKCTGTVNVTKINDNYKYTPFLDCGKDYKVKKLTEYIKENEKIVTTDKGLYELNNEFVYRGENINNNIYFANHNWKIVKIFDDKTLIILDDILKNDINSYWDNRYNEERKAKVGINNYELSRAREYLNTLYEGTTFFTKEDKLLISSYNLNIGKRTLDDQDKTGAPEKAIVLENQYIGLLTAYDYLNASLDSNCKSVNTESCNNYNYLATYPISWWLITGNSENTYEVYKAEATTSLFNARANSNAHFKPVIALTEDTIYVSGNGNKDNPYKIK